MKYWLAFTLSLVAVASPEEIRQKYDDLLKNVTLYAEYPFCSQVVGLRESENKALIIEALYGHHEARRAFIEVDAEFKIPSQKQKAFHAKKTDPRQGFSWETSVFRLEQSEKLGTYVALALPISSIKKGNWVLSSTVSIIEDPRYRRNCWTKVESVKRKDESWFGFLNFTLETPRNVPEGKNFLVSPEHYLFAFCEKCSVYHWAQASTLSVKEGKNSKNQDPAGEEDMLKSRIYGMQGPVQLVSAVEISSAWYVYDLSIPETFSYYVNATVPILAHSAMEEAKD